MGRWTFRFGTGGSSDRWHEAVSVANVMPSSVQTVLLMLGTSQVCVERHFG